ncbi:hypothetical protein AAGG74_16375 [Bacillus mexicanus]|uniref:hypothetical protein n=1 Tax=Bacillus mexicanus TaxID=2834415 RepID=UPI003D22488F
MSNFLNRVETPFYIIETFLDVEETSQYAYQIHGKVVFKDENFKKYVISFENMDSLYIGYSYHYGSIVIARDDIWRADTYIVYQKLKDIFDGNIFVGAENYREIKKKNKQLIRALNIHLKYKMKKYKRILKFKETNII